MLRANSIRIFVLSCIVASAACGSALQDGAEPIGTTEIELLISDPENPGAELTALIDFVSYQIVCADSGLTPYSDNVSLTGNFEADLSADPPVWELATDLPPAVCTISAITLRITTICTFTTTAA